MRLVEFYPERQGRPESKVTLDMDSRAPSLPYGISGILIEASYSTTTQVNNYTAAGYTVIYVDASAGAVTITLPTAADNSGRYYYIKKVDGSRNKVTVASSELIDGESSIGMGLQEQYLMVHCSGIKVVESYWHILGGGNVKLETLIDNLLNDQIDLLRKLLIEAVQIKLHNASISGADITEEDVD